jgi:cytochrome P450 family 4 subfamily B polypeptide 1
MLKEARSGGLLDYLLEMSKIGRLMHMSLGPFVKVLVCTHADPLKLTLGQNPKSELIYYPMYPWLGESLLTGNGKKWARTRRLLTPAFHFDILKPYIPIYESCAKEAIDIWKEKVLNGERIDLFPHISLLTLDVMLRCTCSYESNCQTAKTHSPYVAAVYELSDLTMQRIIFFPAYFDWIYALMPSKYRMDRACNIVHKFSMDVITKRRAVLDDLKKNGKTMQVGQLANGKRKKYLDFIDLLLEAKDENGVGLTNKEIRAEIDTFMFEGHDTTASSVAWTLYNLARYPEHQSKCREEVDAVFDDTKDYLTWEDVKGFQYLKYCIKESLRIFPPVPVIARNLPEDCEYEGQKFIEGTWCITDINAIHHNPDLWDDPEV